MLIMTFVIGVSNVWGEVETITLANGVGSGSGTSYSITWSGTSCDITQTKENSTTNVNPSYISAPRWYQNHKIAFKAKPGYTLAGATIVCTSEAYATALKNSTYSTSASATVSSSKVIITTSGDFDITMGAQSRVSSIEINYIVGSPTEHAINLIQTTGGTIDANKVNAAEGADIILTSTPDLGYAFGSWNVENSSTGASITVYGNKFTMPDADVNVSATFNLFNGAVIKMSAASDADIKFVTGSSSTTGAIWANSTPLSARNITLSGSVTSGTNYSYYDGSVVRFYTNNDIVITPSDGTTIEKIEIVRQTTTGSNGGTINCSGLTASSENTTTNTNVFTGSATSAVTFTNTAQCRFTEIYVYTVGGKTLQSVTVSGEPSRTTYMAGDSFEPEGLTVTATYDKGNPEIVTEGVIWSTPAVLTAGQTSVEVTATYKGITSAPYTVNNLTVKTLDGTQLLLSGTYPTEFWKGDSFSHEGLVAQAKFSTGYEDVTSQVTFSTPNMTQVGTQTITVTYTVGSLSQTATYSINVNTIANTQETAYTVSEAKALIDAGKDLSSQVYVKGVVSEIASLNLTSDGKINFYITEDENSDTANKFEFYHCLNIGGNGFTSFDELEVGAYVIGKGNLQLYKSTYEFSDGCQLVYYKEKETPIITLKTYETHLETDIAKDYLEITYKVEDNDVPEFVTASSVSSVANFETNGTSGTKVMVKPAAEGISTIAVKAKETEHHEAITTRFYLVVNALENANDNIIWTKVTSANELVEGDEIVIVATEDKKAFCEISTSGGVSQYKGLGYDVTILEEGNIVTNAKYATVFKLEKTDDSEDNFVLYSNGHGYLKSHYNTKDRETDVSWNSSVTDNCKWCPTTCQSSADNDIVYDVNNTLYFHCVGTEAGTSRGLIFSRFNYPNGAMPDYYVFGNYAEKNYGTVQNGREFTQSYSPVGIYKRNHILTLGARNEEGHWATFSNDHATFFPSDKATVKKASVEGEVLKVSLANDAESAAIDKTIDGYFVPANTGVLVNSSSEYVTYYLLNKNMGEITENLLYPASKPMSELAGEGNYLFYKLAYGDWDSKANLGFYWGAENGGPFTIKANTAYLAVPEDVAAMVKGFEFYSDETPSGISDMNMDVNDGYIYNLNGQRVVAPVRGQIYIMNGRKYIAK